MANPTQYRVSPINIGNKIAIPARTYYVVLDIANDPLARKVLREYAEGLEGQDREDVLRSLEIAEEMSND